MEHRHADSRLLIKTTDEKHTIEIVGREIDLMASIMLAMTQSPKLQELLENSCKQMRLYQQEQKFKNEK